MKVVLVLGAVIALAWLIPSPGVAREIIDMTGRKVTVPERITRVYATSPPATYLLYALDPGVIAGLNSSISQSDKKLLNARFRSLPVIGSSVGQGKNLNTEMLLQVRPDVVLVWAWPQPELNEKFEQIFRRLKIPTVYVRIDTLKDYPAAFTFLGSLLNRPERALKLKRYAEETLTSVNTALKGIVPAQKPTVYYAEGPDGLATEPDGSFHVELIGAAGGSNVHKGESRGHYGMEKISMEQVMLYNPSIILVQEDEFWRTVAKDSRWKGIKAVKEGKVWRIPRVPFNWVDRPPSFMRFLGLRWLANKFHPDRFPFDAAAETRRFCRLFLGIEPSKNELADILRGS